jgi:hypothetical protein
LIDAGNQLKLLLGALNKLLFYFCELVFVHDLTHLLFGCDFNHVLQVSAELSILMFELYQLPPALLSLTFDLALQVLFIINYSLFQLLIQFS